MKNIAPDIRVGGPYIVVQGSGYSDTDSSIYTDTPIIAKNQDFLDYWLANRRTTNGSNDFITVDRSLRNDQDPNHYTQSQYMDFTDTFGSVVQQLKTLTGGSLDIWFAESYFDKESGRESYYNYGSAGYASILYHMLISGASGTLLWNPMQTASDKAFSHHLFTDTSTTGGGQPLANYFVYKAFHQYFGKNGASNRVLYSATSSSADLEVLASYDHALFINKSGSPVNVNINSGSAYVTLNGYEVRVVDSNWDTILSNEGILVNHDFDAGGLSSAGWTVSAGGGSASVVTDPNGVNGSSVKLDDTSTSGNVSVSRSFTDVSGTVTLEMQMMQGTNRSYSAVNLYDGATRAVEVYMNSSGDLIAAGPGGTTIQLAAGLASNVWHTIKIVADTDTNQFDVTVDNDAVDAGNDFRASADSLNLVECATANDQTAVFYIDDMTITHDFSE